MTLRMLSQVFAVCKVESFAGLDVESPYVFLARTEAERSLVCEVGRVPANATAVEKGWRAFEIGGTLDFGMVGVIAGISRILADAGIPLFVISTYNTDYVLVKAENFLVTQELLEEHGHTLTE